jgi:hypothetical protein
VTSSMKRTFTKDGKLDGKSKMTGKEWRGPLRTQVEKSNLQMRSGFLEMRMRLRRTIVIRCGQPEDKSDLSCRLSPLAW